MAEKQISQNHKTHAAQQTERMRKHAHAYRHSKVEIHLRTDKIPFHLTAVEIQWHIYD